MRAIRSALLTLCLFSCLQTNAQTFEKGQSSINLYYGVTLINTFVKTFASASQINVQASALGPMGVTYEYLLTNRIGLGIEAGYSKSEIKYQEEDMILGVLYSFKINSTYTRVQLRTNLHVLNSKSFDIYILANLGYSGISNSYVTDDPYFIPDFKAKAVVLGVKAGLGFRYFFSKYVGLHSELAIGTPIFSGGLSVRF